MSITVGDVKRISKLAKLKFSDEELEKYDSDLNSIVEFCNSIDSVDTSSVSQEIHSEEKMPERCDVCCACDASVMNNAPDNICGMFAVPKVIGT